MDINNATPYTLTVHFYRPNLGHGMVQSDWISVRRIFRFFWHPSSALLATIYL
jgi:hypothetical protein